MAPSSELADSLGHKEAGGGSAIQDSELPYGFGPSEEPRTLEIQYAGAEPGTDPQREVVFEDPSQNGQRPRLLVSLQGVTALKSLCEREFSKVQLASSMLSCCRSDYYKELLWLREQLILARHPEKAMLVDAVKNYEVYFFSPPKYVDEQTRDFLLDCVRWNSKKLIEENHELLLSLEGRGGAPPPRDPEAALRSFLQAKGPRAALKRLHTLIGGQDQARERLLELQEAAAELFPELSQKAAEAQVGELQAELRRAGDRARGAEELRAQVQALQAEVAAEHQAAGQQQARAEEALRRGEEERRRAEEALAALEREGQRAEALGQELDEAHRGLAAARAEAQGPELEQCRGVADKAAHRILAVVDELGETLSRRTSLAQLATVTPPKSRAASANTRSAHDALEDAVNSLEEIVTASCTRNPEGCSEASDGLQEQLESLEAQLRQAREAEAAARQEASRLKREAAQGSRQSLEAEGLRAELDRAQAALTQATAEAERASRAEQALGAEIERLTAENARLQAAAAKPGTEEQESARVEQLMEELRGAASSQAQAKAKLREAEEKFEAAAASAERLRDKLAEAQKKNTVLKNELKEWKAKCGVEVEESEDDESEEELPSFLTAYSERIKYSSKPRWLLLSEDATLARQKKDYLHGQRFATVDSHASEASLAFHFLRSHKADPVQGGQRSWKQQRWHEDVLTDNFGGGFYNDGVRAGPPAAVSILHGYPDYQEPRAEGRRVSTELVMSLPSRSQNRRQSRSYSPPGSLQDASPRHVGGPNLPLVMLSDAVSPTAVAPLEPTPLQSSSPSRHQPGTSPGLRIRRKSSLLSGPDIADPNAVAGTDLAEGAGNENSRASPRQESGAVGSRAALPLRPLAQWSAEPSVRLMQGSPLPALGIVSLGSAMRKVPDEVLHRSAAPGLGALPLYPRGHPTPPMVQWSPSQPSAEAAAEADALQVAPGPAPELSQGSAAIVDAGAWLLASLASKQPSAASQAPAVDITPGVAQAPRPLDPGVHVADAQSSPASPSAPASASHAPAKVTRPGLALSRSAASLPLHADAAGSPAADAAPAAAGGPAGAAAALPRRAATTVLQRSGSCFGKLPELLGPACEPRSQGPGPAAGARAEQPEAPEWPGPAGSPAGPRRAGAAGALGAAPRSQEGVRAPPPPELRQLPAGSPKARWLARETAVAALAPARSSIALPLTNKGAQAPRSRSASPTKPRRGAAVALGEHAEAPPPGSADAFSPSPGALPRLPPGRARRAPAP